mmetsp:Transcript_44995/g.73427  ORF Transcript_44995/g.73427 Transcript_44995/m.73427 type:complete len:82 (+) Transcript_44995:32-277(+)
MLPHTGVSSPQYPPGKNDSVIHKSGHQSSKQQVQFLGENTSEEGKLLPLLTKITAIGHRAPQIPKPCMSITPTWPLRNITS